MKCLCLCYVEAVAVVVRFPNMLMFCRVCRCCCYVCFIVVFSVVVYCCRCCCCGFDFFCLVKFCCSVVAVYCCRRCLVLLLSCHFVVLLVPVCVCIIVF